MYDSGRCPVLKCACFLDGEQLAVFVSKPAEWHHSVDAVDFNSAKRRLLVVKPTVWNRPDQLVYLVTRVVRGCSGGI